MDRKNKIEERYNERVANIKKKAAERRAAVQNNYAIIDDWEKSELEKAKITRNHRLEAYNLSLKK